MNKSELREQLPFRPCVGIALFNAQGKVFAGKRISKNGGTSEYAWQLPQGGIDKGEDALVAAKRELYEETNVTSVELIMQAPEQFDYDLPEELIGIGLKGKYRGQRQDWFAFRFVGHEDEINVLAPAEGAHPAEFDDWAWCDLSEMPDLIVPFKRELYVKILDAFASIRPKD